MLILKILNNNALVCRNEKNEECIAMGKGIGFHRKPGDEISSSKIEKLFTAEEAGDLKRRILSVQTIPDAYYELTERIILYTDKVLQRELNKSLIFTLADHIHFTVTHHEISADLINPLLWEIRQVYTAEYLIGCYAVEEIRKAFQVELTDSAAASIALHIINAELNRETGPRENRPLSSANLIAEVHKAIQSRFSLPSLAFQTTFGQILIQSLKSLIEETATGKTVHLPEGGLMKKLMESSHPDLCTKTAFLMKELSLKYSLPRLEEETGFLAYLIYRITESQQ